jgi:hypothetical protein
MQHAATRLDTTKAQIANTHRGFCVLLLIAVEARFI